VPSVDIVEHFVRAGGALPRGPLVVRPNDARLELEDGRRRHGDFKSNVEGIRTLAANGQDAFLQAMENQPDIVLMDVNLEGGREGIEAARWLREVCDIPVVFVTAYTDPDTVERIHEQVPRARSSQSHSIASTLLRQ
jgi:CheY-like chemotaxis protein